MGMWGGGWGVVGVGWLGRGGCGCGWGEGLFRNGSLDFSFLAETSGISMGMGVLGVVLVSLFVFCFFFFFGGGEGGGRKGLDSWIWGGYLFFGEGEVWICLYGMAT